MPRHRSRRPAARVLGALVGCIALLLAGCALEEPASQENDVKVNVDSPPALQQFRANLEFASGYEARCSKTGKNPRVLVTGFGRFMDNRRNATGLMLERLLPELVYPMTEPPPKGAIDLPGPQLAVAQGTLALPRTGEVDVCAMVLPVFWDLAAVLALAEIAAFEPELVVMNGIASPNQAVWLELGAINRAEALHDGSGVLVAEAGPVVATAPPAEYGRANLLSWQAVRGAMLDAVASADSVHEGAAFQDVVTGARFAGFPRASNTYLCNNTTYAVGYVMDHPNEPVHLLVPSDSRYGDGLTVASSVDRSAVPRVFLHWSQNLDGAHLDSAAAVLAAALDAQLAVLGALSDEPLPTRGDNAMAEIPSGS